MPNCYNRRIKPIKLLHFEKLNPLCPVCRCSGHPAPLEITKILKGSEDSINEGILVCTNSQCLSEYPIIDGLPIIVANLRSYISQNILPVLARDDLTGTMESLLGDCLGPGSHFDSYRQHISTYAFDHYGDLDPEQESPSVAQPGSIVRLLDKGLRSIEHHKEGPVIDLGCSVGRTSFELAGKLDKMVLGVDLNFGMLKTAASILEKGLASYPQRRGGIVFERKTFPAIFEKSEMVDFWVCDATALPFSNEAFALGVSLNVLDCIASPYEHLRELSRILAPEGKAIISSPYDWSTGATPVEAWLGGHSQRSENKGASDVILRSLLSGGSHPKALQELIFEFEHDFPWTLRLHDRSSVEYIVQLFGVQKKKPA